MADDVAGSRPCFRGECERHYHAPCELGWTGPDTVCPCWAGRRRLEVHHSGPPTAGPAAAMPASIRSAWNTAKADRGPLPHPTRNFGAQHPAADAAPPASTPIDPRAEAILAALGLDPARAVSARRLVRALVVAVEAGWPEAHLIELLQSTTEPDGRPPTLLWTWTIEHLGKPTTSNGA